MRLGRREARLSRPAGNQPSGALGDLLKLLRCPRTRAELRPGVDGSLVSESGRSSYPVVAGVPILIDDARSLVDALWTLDGRARSMLDESGTHSALRRALGTLLRWLPTSERNVAARRNLARLAQLLRVRAASGRRPRMLLIGASASTDAAGDLLGRPELEVIEADIAFSASTNVVCDPHDLPFADGAFDAVMIRSVLEGVLDPPRVASEVHRVLAGDGLVYSEAGFVRQTDVGALDFNRFTHLGHRRLWRCFDEIDSGAQSGPATALLRAIEHFFRSFLGESRLARAAVRRAVALAGFWLKYLDHLLARRPGGIDAASATFFLGTRRETPVPDRVIVAGFRGIAVGGQRLPAPRLEPAPVDEIRASRGIRIFLKERAPKAV
jgi:SAM-dependent methyltransferase